MRVRATSGREGMIVAAFGDVLCTGTVYVLMDHSPDDPMAFSVTMLEALDEEASIALAASRLRAAAEADLPWAS